MNLLYNLNGLVWWGFETPINTCTSMPVHNNYTAIITGLFQCMLLRENKGATSMILDDYTERYF